MFVKRSLRVLGAFAVAMSLAAAARAQAIFYREEAKDGRIFAFAMMGEYKRWMQANGEMGKSISRIGYGPAGETVVFDSEDAINLYNFKHDKPGEVFEKKPEPPKPAEPVARVGGTIFSEFTYNQRGYVLDSSSPHG